MIILGSINVRILMDLGSWDQQEQNFEKTWEIP
jgi:hypothetical protein